MLEQTTDKLVLHPNVAVIHVKGNPARYFQYNNLSVSSEEELPKTYRSIVGGTVYLLKVYSPTVLEMLHSNEVNRTDATGVLTPERMVVKVLEVEISASVYQPAELSAAKSVEIDFERLRLTVTMADGTTYSVHTHDCWLEYPYNMSGCAGDDSYVNVMCSQVYFQVVLDGHDDVCNFFNSMRRAGAGVLDNSSGLVDSAAEKTEITMIDFD